MKSTEDALHQGDPQGWVLSPTLFMLFLSDIEKVISKRCEVGLFADDVVMWDSGTDLQKSEDLPLKIYGNSVKTSN
ncbi:hypothetical protein CDAR_223161 [Caerostris darwini]|uniref:Reverse transcriptase domain-containing protein n=1 Tax=Caerostris darwini TaxID=1538125 RepID=A0AAV4N3Q2_9ARAC|nr:hypothetical protein CDAR_223161 [Caerostris darwini]